MERINLKNRGQLRRNLNKLFKEDYVWNIINNQTTDIELHYPCTLNLRPDKTLTWTTSHQV